MDKGERSLQCPPEEHCDFPGLFIYAKEKRPIRKKLEEKLTAMAQTPARPEEN